MLVPATNEVTPVLVIVEAPVAPDIEMPVPATFEVTPVFAIVAFDAGPPSVTDILFHLSKYHLMT